MPVMENYRPAKMVTSGKHHFFGYYDKCQWDATDRYMIALETEFMNRAPEPDDVAVIGLIDTQNDNEWKPVAETTAWCWQQSCMLHWLPSAADREIIYNVKKKDKFVAEIRDVFTGETREIPHAIYCLSPNGKEAIGHNFARVGVTRPGYGYVGLPDPWHDDLAPADDGLYHINLETGETELIVTLKQIAEMKPYPNVPDAKHWFNHIQFNPDGSRFIFLHRARCLKTDEFLGTNAFTANPDGSGLHCMYDEGRFSHFDWQDPKHLMAWSCTEGLGEHFIIYTDQSDVKKVFAEKEIQADGHNSFSPDRKWIANDTYPAKEDHKRTLMVVEIENEKRVDLGRFYAPPELKADFRCDLHPRWNRKGTKISFDSAHEGMRQVYICDVEDIVKG